MGRFNVWVHLYETPCGSMHTIWKEGALGQARPLEQLAVMKNSSTVVYTPSVPTHPYKLNNLNGCSHMFGQEGGSRRKGLLAYSWSQKGTQHVCYSVFSIPKLQACSGVFLKSFQSRAQVVV